MSMAKPDRIERAVKTLTGKKSGLTWQEGVSLVRKEAAYQRAQMRKIIKAQTRWVSMRTLPSRPMMDRWKDGNWIHLPTLLAALTPRRTR